jgi:hypothetical protein
LLAAAAAGQLALVLRAADDFGLSGIGDLSLVEGFDEPKPNAALVAPVAAAAPEAIDRRREVTFISAGVPQVLLTERKEER